MPSTVKLRHNFSTGRRGGRRAKLSDTAHARGMTIAKAEGYSLYPLASYETAKLVLSRWIEFGRHKEVKFKLYPNKTSAAGYKIWYLHCPECNFRMYFSIKLQNPSIFNDFKVPTEIPIFHVRHSNYNGEGWYWDTWAPSDSMFSGYWTCSKIKALKVNANDPLMAPDPS